jgi:hypothetical protein
LQNLNMPLFLLYRQGVWTRTGGDLDSGSGGGVRRGTFEAWRCEQGTAGFGSDVQKENAAVMKDATGGEADAAAEGADRSASSSSSSGGGGSTADSLLEQSSLSSSSSNHNSSTGPQLIEMQMDLSSGSDSSSVITTSMVEEAARLPAGHGSGGAVGGGATGTGGGHGYGGDSDESTDDLSSVSMREVLASLARVKQKLLQQQ